MELLKKHDIIKHKSYPKCTFVINSISEGLAFCSRIHKKKMFSGSLEWVSFGNKERAFSLDSKYITKIDEWKD